MRRPLLVLFYVLTLPAMAAVFFLIRATAGQPAAQDGAISPRSAAASGEATSVFLQVLVALALVVSAARILAALFRWLGQPQVAGLLLGPSFFGWLAPKAAAALLPLSIAPYLAVIAQVGIVLFMFLVGVELDTGLLRQRTRAFVAISHSSIVAPFLLGTALALWLYPHFAGAGVTFTAFALFVGVAMSVTAFPVLARILTDSKMQKSRLGALALGCAAVDDVTAWCLLAVVVSVARARSGQVLLTVGATLAFTLFVVLVVRKGAMWLVRRRETAGGTTQGTFATVCVSLLVCALATERIGIHALFGAFLLGSVVPHDSALARDIRGKCEDLVVVLFLPVFFAFTGMRTQVGLLENPADWLVLAVIILVATAGKFGGTFLAARWTGSDAREAASLGVLMNTRGLMELVVLNVGLDLGVLSPALFAMFVLMAIVTTLAAAPALQLLMRGKSAGDLA